MANGKINELFDFEEIDKQFNQKLDEYGNKLKEFPAMKVKLEGAESLKQFVKANEDFAKSIKDIEALQQQLSVSQAKIIELEKKFAEEKNKSTKANEDYNASAKETIVDNEKIKSSYSALGKSIDDNIKRQIGLKAATQTLKAEQKELQAGIDLFSKAPKTPENLSQLDALIAKQVAVAKAIEATSQESKSLQKTIRLQVQEQNANTGSLEEMKATYERLYQTFSKLSEADQQSAFGKELSGDLDLLKSKINDIQKGAGDFSANVGRYAESLAKPFELLQRKIAELKGNLASGTNGKTGGPLDPQAVTQSTLALNAMNGALSKSQAAGATTTTQLRALTEAYVALGGIDDTITGSNFIEELGDSIGEAKDQVDDLKSELRIKASDTQGIDNVVGSLNAIAGAAQGAASAYVLLGGSEEDAAKVTAKLLALQGIANSVQQVGTELTRRGSAAYKAYAAVQNLVAVSTDRNAAATLRLAAASKLLFGGAIIGALAFLVIKLREYQKANEEAGRSVKDLNEVREKGLQNAASELSTVRLLYEASQNQSLSLKDRKNAVDELQKQYPAYFKNIKDETILTGGAAGAYDKLTKSIIQTGLAQAAREKISEISAGILDDTIKLEEANGRIEQILKNGVAIQDKIQPKTLASGNVVNTSPVRISFDEKDKEKAIAGVKEFYKDSYAVVEAGNKRIDAIVKGIGANNIVNQIIGKPEEVAKAQKISDNTAQELLKSQFERNKLRIQQNLSANEEIIKNDEIAFKDRFIALIDFYANSERLIALQTQYEIQAEEAKTRKIIEGLQEQKKEKGANKQAIDKQIERETIASADRLKTIEANNYQARLDLSVDYSEKYIEITKRTTKELQIQGAERAAQYLKNARDVEEQVRQIQKESVEKQKELRRKLYADLQDLFFGFLQGNIDREIAHLEEKKVLQDIDTQRQIANVGAQGLSEVDRVRQVSMIQKQALAQTEIIEKRKIQLAKDRKKVEQLADVAQIGGELAKNVFELSAKVVQAKAAAALYALNPATAYLVPRALASAAMIAAQIPLTIGIGAVNLAKVLAFAKGTDNAPAGPAIVSEEGSEMLIDRLGRMFLTPSKPTLMQLAGGEKIIPHNITKTVLASMNLNHMINQAGGKSVEVTNSVTKNDINRLIKSVEKSRPTVIVHNQKGIESSAWYQNKIK